MAEKTNGEAFVFIVGSPRSGTTILGELLDNHHQISQWYEPYFVWDRFFRAAPHDERTQADASPQVSAWIYRNFARYKQKKKCSILIDKSPRNSLKIPFILKIFPQAKFIHLLRDGRDVTLSINKEWLRRRTIVKDPQSGGRFNYGRAVEVIYTFLNRQPFIKDKWRALWFETHGHLLNKKKHLNRLRWKGEIGWGPRFKDWERIYEQSSLLQFNAHQWLNCVDRIKLFWPQIPQDNILEVKYEDLLQQQNKVIEKILDFLEVKSYRDFFSSIPKLKTKNYNKWQKEFSESQIQEIQPILIPRLIKLGYSDGGI